MELNPRARTWKKTGPSVAAIVAVVALFFVIVGVMFPGASMVTPATAGAAASSDTVVNLLFGAGTVLAGLFIVVYVFKLGEHLPGKKRYDSN
jgi:hypothetical protein